MFFVWVFSVHVVYIYNIQRMCKSVEIDLHDSPYLSKCDTRCCASAYPSVGTGAMDGTPRRFAILRHRWDPKEASWAHSKRQASWAGLFLCGGWSKYYSRSRMGKQHKHMIDHVFFCGKRPHSTDVLVLPCMLQALRGARRLKGSCIVRNFHSNLPELLVASCH